MPLSKVPQKTKDEKRYQREQRINQLGNFNLDEIQDRIKRIEKRFEKLEIELLKSIKENSELLKDLFEYNKIKPIKDLPPNYERPIKKRNSI